MTDQLTIAHHRITDAVEQLTTGIDWQTMPDVAARFHTYSPNNIWLILAQRPDATRVAGYHTWRNLDRWVRKREHGIAVLAPIVGDAPTTAWDMLAAPIADAGFSLERGDGANGNTNHTTHEWVQCAPTHDSVATMSRVIQIRDVPDDVHDALADAAEAQGLSLTRYMLRELEHLAKRAQAVHANATVIRQTQAKVRGHVDRDTILTALSRGRGD